MPITIQEIATLALRIAEGMANIEKYLKIPLETVYGNDARVYYVVGDFEIC
jgi:hypothetical protein